jgi:hypothetical protein
VDANLAQQRIKAAIKLLLKRGDHTYADLANVWNCSVPTVKRQLGPEELPLSRLLSLLEWLGLSLSDLQKLAESESLTQPKYTTKQLEFLAKNPREFAFLMKLYEELTPDQIVKKYKLSAQVLEKILIALEKHDLIRVGVGGRVKPFYERVAGVEGPLAEVQLRRIIDRTAQFQKGHIYEMLAQKARGIEVPYSTMSMAAQLVSPKTFQDYTAKFRQLHDELSTVSSLEEKTLKKSELKMGVSNFGLFLCEENDPFLPLVTELFDDDLRAPASIEAVLPG